jgi:hypothetical protein
MKLKKTLVLLLLLLLTPVMLGCDELLNLVRTRIRSKILKNIMTCYLTRKTISVTRISNYKLFYMRN